MIEIIGILAQVDAVDPTAIPSWVWPPALVIIGLAVAAAWLNVKEVWVSGREMRGRLAASDVSHAAEIKGKNDTITLLQTELAKADGRWERERDQRIADAQAMATLTQASRLARDAMTEVVEGLGHDPGNDGGAYATRMEPRRRRPKGSG